MKTTDRTTQLFSLDNLPSNPEFLKALHEKIHDTVGESDIQLSAEVKEHFEVIKSLRDSLIVEAQDDPKSAATAVSAINAFTNILHKVSELQQRTSSQESFRLLFDTVIDVLSEEDHDLRRRVIAGWKEKLKEMS